MNQESNENKGTTGVPLDKIVRPYWKPLHGDSGHYNITRIDCKSDSIDALRAMFSKPATDVNEMNFVLFSTSGAHGTYQTIEEEEADPGCGVTFLIIHPRLVSLRYGVALPLNEDDFLFLKALRKESLKVMNAIGA
jgi:hypothetical protein